MRQLPSADAPGLIAEMGWAEFNHTPYKELQDSLHLGTSCAGATIPALSAAHYFCAHQRHGKTPTWQSQTSHRSLYLCYNAM